MSKMKFGRYDYASCLTFASYAVCSMIVPMCLVALSIDLGFPLEEGGMRQGGLLQIGRSVPMVLAMVLCGFAAGKWGKRRTLGYSILFMAAGIILASMSPGYGILFVALVISGLGEGTIEGLATPYVQDLHPDQPGRYLNVSQAFWSIGVVAVVLVAGFLLYNGVSWRVVILATGIGALIPVLLLLWPVSGGSHVEHDARMTWLEVCRSVWDIFRNRRFWLFFVAMFFAGGGEFCLTFWCASFIQIEFGASPRAAGLGTACFAAGMIAGRLLSGVYVHQHNLKNLIVWLSCIATVVTLFFPWIESLAVLFILLFIAGIAAGPFWPSIQSDGANRIKSDHTMMMILFSCAGVPGCGFFTAAIGFLGDLVGLRMSFLIVPACFGIVFLLMGYDMLREGRGLPGTAHGVNSQSRRASVRFP